MSARNDGGSAFPVTDAQSAMPGTVDEMKALARGMSLRDHYAGLAMQAQVITDMVPGEACNALLEAAGAAGQDPTFRLALNSYHIADAMLKARDA